MGPDAAIAPYPPDGPEIMPAFKVFRPRDAAAKRVKSDDDCVDCCCDVGLCDVADCDCPLKAVDAAIFWATSLRAMIC